MTARQAPREHINCAFRAINKSVQDLEDAECDLRTDASKAICKLERADRRIRQAASDVRAALRVLRQEAKP
jgi:translation initiation factor 2B subunit (eIF-2B alpha/beta/delta family)